ncbi:MAG: ABC transporter permease, partial [Methyloligellaceae bacterium]
VAILLPAAATVREKEYGTIEIMLVSPLRTWEIMLAKIIPMAGISLVFTLISVFAVLGAGFGVYPTGSLGVFLVATAIYVYACCGLGMLLATFAKNLSQVILILITVFVPIVFLSGTWTPPEAMPVGLQWFTYVSPLSYYLDISTGVFFRGWGWHESLAYLAMLSLLGAILFLVGTRRLGRQFA